MAMKSCPACQKQVGPRTKKCECGHAFATETAAVPASGESMTLDPLDKRVAESVSAVKDIIAKVEKRPSVSEAVVLPTPPKEDARRTQIVPPSRNYGGGGRIITPAGACPVKPEGFKEGWPDGPASDEVVQTWAYAVYDSGGGRYSPEAVIYWARYFWDINGSEYRRVRDLIVRALQPQRQTTDSADDD